MQVQSLSMEKEDTVCQKSPLIAFFKKQTKQKIKKKKAGLLQMFCVIVSLILIA